MSRILKLQRKSFYLLVLPFHIQHFVMSQLSTLERPSVRVLISHGRGFSQFPGAHGPTSHASDFHKIRKSKELSCQIKSFQGRLSYLRHTVSHTCAAFSQKLDFQQIEDHSFGCPSPVNTRTHFMRLLQATVFF